MEDYNPNRHGRSEYVVKDDDPRGASISMRAAAPSLDMGFDEVMAGIDLAHQNLAQLEKHLTPVLMIEDPNQGSRPSIGEDPGWSPAFSRIHNMRESISYLNQRISEITNRVQL